MSSAGSIVTVQVGQAGNQVGCKFFGNLAGAGAGASEDHFDAATRTRFFDEGSKGGLPAARAVMVDMEPKVIQAVTDEAKRSGYNHHGEASVETVLEMVARETEKCDRLEGFVLPMSVAGGTGSGVGTRITEGLRDYFPHSIITNQVIWPYSSGEVIVQNYNAMLALAHIHQHSDAITLIENDSVHEVCAKMMKLKTVSFNLMNEEIAKGLEGVLRPAVACEVGTLKCAGKPTGRSAALHDLVATLCPNPGYKVLNVRRVPQMPDASMEFTTYNWPSLLKTLRQMLIANGCCEEGINWRVKVPSPGGVRSPYFNTSVANLLVLRGSELGTADPRSFADPTLYAPWTADPVAIWSASNPGGRHKKSATLLSNSYGVVHPLKGTVSKAWDMFTARAFVHQYQQHGVTEDDFVDSFAKCEQIIANYDALAPPSRYGAK